jgi:hypothetical protein
MAETISTQRFILGIPWTPVPLHFGWTRNTRDGWPLLTVETEANGDSGSTVHMKGALPWLVPWAPRASTRESVLTCLL